MCTAGALIFALCSVACRDAEPELPVEPRLAQARALQEAKSFAESIVPLRSFLAETPNNAEANHRLGLALAQTGEVSRAVWRLLRASESEEYAVESGMLLASLMLSSRNSDEALRAADRVLAFDPSNVDAQRVRGAVRLSAGDHQGALDAAETIGVAVGADAQALALRGAALAGLERYDEAEAVFLELRDVTAASEDVQVAARGCLAPVGFYADTREDSERAEAALSHCLTQYPTFRLVLSAASSFYDSEEATEKANSLWRQALEKNPEEIALYSTLAGRLEQAGEIEESRIVLVAATERIGSSVSWQLLSDFYRRQGEHEAARAALERALADAGQRAEMLRFTQADLLADAGELAAAEDIASSLEDPAMRELMRARILVAHGRDREALAAFDDGILRWPNNAGARILAGQAAERLGDYRRALEEYRAAVRSGRRETDAALVAARLHFALGEYRAAMEFAQLYVRSRKPQVNPEAYVLAARAATALGRHEAARRIVDELAKVDGQSTTALLERASVERAATGVEAGVAVLRAAERDLGDADNAAVLRVLVDSLLAAGDVDAALEEAEAALAAAPDTASFHDLRARVLAGAGRQEEARRGFEKALALEAAHAPSLVGLATLAAQRGEIDTAIALFERASAADPPGIEPRYQAAQLLLAAGRSDDALAALTDLVREAPAHAAACNDLAWLLAEQETDLDRARELAERAVRLDRGANTLDTLGWVHLKRGERDAAKRLFAEALELDADAPGVRDHLELASEPVG